MILSLEVVYCFYHKYIIERSERKMYDACKCRVNMSGMTNVGMARSSELIT